MQPAALSLPTALHSPSSFAPPHYQAYLEEYSIVKDSISDEDVRRVSKAKVAYQKLQVRNFTDKTTDQVTDVANTIGTKVSKVFKRTKKKVQGAIEGFKKE